MSVKGRPLSDEHKRKIRETRKRKGIKPWNAGLKGISGQKAWNKDLPPEQQPFYGKEHTDDHKMWLSDWNIKRMKDGTHNWVGEWDDYGPGSHMVEYKDGVKMSPEMLEHFRNAMNKE